MVRLVLPVIAACLAWTACRKPPVAVYRDAPVVVVSIDTLRADRIGAYGHRGAATPKIDALAREGVLFEDAYSSVPLTLPAHASMFTGLLPPHHGVRDNVGFTLKADKKTLASCFQAAGAKTGAAISAYVLRRQTGIDHGFDFFDDALTIEDSGEFLGSVQRDGGVAVESLSRWIDGVGTSRFFAFLHLYEPHSPQAPPDRYKHLATPYDGDVAYADELVGRFLDGLRSKGVLDKAIVVLTSDHGEGLRDHGEEEHGIFLYKEAVHIPLVVRLPGASRAGTRVTGTVSLVDVAPTILDLAGLDASGTDGASLRAAMDTSASPNRPAYSETLYPKFHFGWSDLYSVTEGRLRYIRAPRPELFDLSTDPGEKQNVIASKAGPVAAMNTWLDKIASSDMGSAPEAVPSDVRERLAALGYVGIGTTAKTAGDLPDPKDRIGGYEKYREALTLRQQGRATEAAVALRAVVAENPRMVDAWYTLGVTLAGAGQTKDGIAALAKSLELEPQKAESHLALAKVYALSGDTKRAVAHGELAAAANPAAGFELLAQVMMDASKPDQAALFARRAVDADGDRIMAHFILGDIARRAGRYQEALRHYESAQTAKERRKMTVVRNLYYAMGDCLARLGREGEAEAAFKREIAQLPTSRDGHVALAMLYRSQGRDQQARQSFEDLVRAESAPSADTYAVAVRTLSVLGDGEGARSFAVRAQQLFPADRRFR